VTLPVPARATEQLPRTSVETETHPAATTESQITITVIAPEHFERLSSTPLILAKKQIPALPSSPALSPIPAIQPAPGIEPAPAVPPTEVTPQPPLPAAPTTPNIRRVSVSRKYCEVVLFK